jgi:hypothetical protein
LQPQAREKADKEGFEISVVKTSFKANTKALAENEGDGLAKVTQYCFSTLLHSKFMQRRVPVDTVTRVPDLC